MTHATDTPAQNPMFALLTPLQTERRRQPEANVFNAPGPSSTLSVASSAAPPPQQLSGACFAVFYAGNDQTTEHKRALRNVLASSFTPSTTMFAVRLPASAAGSPVLRVIMRVSHRNSSCLDSSMPPSSTSSSSPSSSS